MHQSFSLLRWYCSKDPSRAHYNPVHFVKEDGNLVLGKWAVTRLVPFFFYLPPKIISLVFLYLLSMECAVRPIVLRVCVSDTARVAGVLDTNA